jgi:SAM-dependent methyltransferase
MINVMDDIIKNTFEIYSKKTDSDYWVYDDRGLRVPTEILLLNDSDSDKVIIENDTPIFKKLFVDELSPDNIDSRKFWKVATDNFPLFSIAGGISNIKTIDEVNKATTELAISFGCIKALSIQLLLNPKLRMLEIGPGHGNIKNLLADNKLDENYYAIDVNPLFEYPRLYQTDGKNIPDTIPYPMDLVYSVNVFQHLSKAQRTSYYKQIFEVLKDGGVFIFGMFVITEENKNWPCWGTKDTEGNFYCRFFRQLTKIDHIYELYDELKNIGFSNIEQINPNSNKTHYLTFKVIK